MPFRGGSAWRMKPLSNARSLFLATAKEKEDEVFFLSFTTRPLTVASGPPAPDGVPLAGHSYATASPSVHGNPSRTSTNHPMESSRKQASSSPSVSSSMAPLPMRERREGSARGDGDERSEAQGRTPSVSTSSSTLFIPKDPGGRRGLGRGMPGKHTMDTRNPSSRVILAGATVKETSSFPRYTIDKERKGVSRATSEEEELPLHRKSGAVTRKRASAGKKISMPPPGFWRTDANSEAVEEEMPLPLLPAASPSPSLRPSPSAVSKTTPERETHRTAASSSSPPIPANVSPLLLPSHHHTGVKRRPNSCSSCSGSCSCSCSCSSCSCSCSVSSHSHSSRSASYSYSSYSYSCSCSTSYSSYSTPPREPEEEEGLPSSRRARYQFNALPSHRRRTRGGARRRGSALTTTPRVGSFLAGRHRHRPPPFPPPNPTQLCGASKYLIAVLRTYEIICVNLNDGQRGPVEMHRYPPPPYLRGERNTGSPPRTMVAKNSTVEDGSTPYSKDTPHRTEKTPHAKRRAPPLSYPTSFSLIPSTMAALVASRSTSPLLRGVVGGSDGRVNVFSERGYAFGFAAHQSAVVTALATYAFRSSSASSGTATERRRHASSYGGGPTTWSSRSSSPLASTTKTRSSSAVYQRSGSSAGGRSRKRSESFSGVLPLHSSWGSSGYSSVTYPSLGFITSAVDGSTFIWHAQSSSSTPRRNGRRCSSGRGRREQPASASPWMFAPQRLFPERPFLAKMMALEVYYPPLVDLSRYLQETSFPKDTPLSTRWGRSSASDTSKTEEGKSGHEAGMGTSSSPHSVAGVSTLSSASSEMLWRLASLLPCAVVCHASTEQFTMVPFYPFPTVPSLTVPLPGAPPPVRFAACSSIPLPSPPSSSWCASSTSVRECWKKGKACVLGGSRGGRDNGDCTALATNGDMALLARDGDVYCIHFSASMPGDGSQHHRSHWISHFNEDGYAMSSSSRFRQRAGKSFQRFMSSISFSTKKGKGKRPSLDDLVSGSMDGASSGFSMPSVAPPCARLPPTRIFHSPRSITSIQLGRHVAVLAALKEGMLTLIAPTLPTAVRLAEFHSYHHRPLRQVVWCEEAALMSLVDEACGVVELVSPSVSILSMAAAVMQNPKGEGLVGSEATQRQAAAAAAAMADASRRGILKKIPCLPSWWSSRTATAARARGKEEEEEDVNRTMIAPPSCHPLAIAFPTIRLLQARCALDDVLAQRRMEWEGRQRAHVAIASVIQATVTYRSSHYAKMGRRAGTTTTPRDGWKEEEETVEGGPPPCVDGVWSAQNGMSHRKGEAYQIPQKGEDDGWSSSSSSTSTNSLSGEPWASPQEEKEEEEGWDVSGGRSSHTRRPPGGGQEGGHGSSGEWYETHVPSRTSRRGNKLKKVMKKFHALRSPEIPYTMREVVGNLRRTVRHRANVLRHPHRTHRSSAMGYGTALPMPWLSSSLSFLPTGSVTSISGYGYGSGVASYPSLQRCREAFLLAKMVCEDHSPPSSTSSFVPRSTSTPPTSILPTSPLEASIGGNVSSSMTSLRTCDGGP